MTSPLADKVILITGAARGIGERLARDAARRGARVVLVGLEMERLRSLASALGPGHLACEADVTDQAAIGRAVQVAVSACGGLDVVVANAGIASNSTVAVAPIEALVRTIEVNLIGVVRTVSATLPAVSARRGYYLLVASASAIITLPALSAYGASKIGVEHFGRALRYELAHKGVQVGVAMPGWIDTDLVRDARADLAAFDRILRRMPGPFGKTITVEACSTALLRGIERRQRTIFVPRSLAWFAALRTVMWSPLFEALVQRIARRAVPELEAEVQTLGRSFGASSVECAVRQ